MHANSRGGLPLLGISLLLFLLSVVAAFAVPIVQDSQRRARIQATLADLRQFETAFQAYAHSHGDWPHATVGPGSYPSGMEAALAATRWSQPTPIGGRYIWLTDTLQRGQRLPAAIAIVGSADDRPTADRHELDALVRLADENKATAHRLRLGFRDEPVYALEQ